MRWLQRPTTSTEEEGELNGTEERSGARCRRGDEEMRRWCEWSVGWRRRSEGAGWKRRVRAQVVEEE